MPPQNSFMNVENWNKIWMDKIWQFFEINSFLDSLNFQHD